MFYQLPVAPEWLRQRKQVQVVISGAFSIGLMAAICMLFQSLADLGSVGVLHIALACATVAVFAVAWRQIRVAEKRMARSGLGAPADFARRAA